MLRFLDRLDALSLNLIWNFEITSKPPLIGIELGN
jgi:hypothetical protein